MQQEPAQSLAQSTRNKAREEKSTTFRMEGRPSSSKYTCMLRSVLTHRLRFMRSVISIASLPPELYTAILDHVELSRLQATSLAISRALPHSAIPMHHLFKSVTIRTRQQVILLMKRLVFGREKGKAEANWVRYFDFRGWDVDADVLNKWAIVSSRPPNLDYNDLNSTLMIAY